MTLSEANRAVGNQPIWAMRNMRKALEMLPWLNTESDWQRLEACYIIMKTPRNKRITKVN